MGTGVPFGGQLWDIKEKCQERASNLGSMDAAPHLFPRSFITSLTSITHPLLHPLNYLFMYSLIHTTFSPIPRQPRKDIRDSQLFGGHQAGAHRTVGGDNPKVLRWKWEPPLNQPEASPQRLCVVPPPRGH